MLEHTSSMMDLSSIGDGQGRKGSHLVAGSQQVTVWVPGSRKGKVNVALQSMSYLARTGIYEERMRMITHTCHQTSVAGPYCGPVDCPGQRPFAEQGTMFDQAPAH